MRRFSSLVKHTENLRPKLNSILNSFDAPIRFCVAYGSGIYKQSNHTSKPMLDFIFGVTHPEHWHSLNIRQNPDHYSSLMRMMGTKNISRLQESGGGVYFHPYIKTHDCLIKYGVVGMDTLLNDLNSWNSLYLAGRFHKPTLVLRDDTRVEAANRTNLYGAVRTAALMLPEEFTEEELFLKIAGLSYIGDPRMGIAEDPHKVFNIVHAQMDLFRRMYGGVIDDLPLINYMGNGMIQKENDKRMIQRTIQNLPRGLISKLTKSENTTQIAKELSSNPNLNLLIHRALQELVNRPATVQSIKGVLSAGVYKSALYLSEKIRKRFK